jgi:hypothetical protein
MELSSVGDALSAFVEIVDRTQVSRYASKSPY